METLRLYRRALGMLASEKWLAWSLVAASVAVAVVQLAEPILFGRVVDALAGPNAAGAFSIIAIWAALGFFGILAGVLLAVAADRLAHRRRLLAMSDAFERAITLPLGYHAQRGSGAVVRTILAGTDALFWLWLGALREHATAFVGVLLLIPTALTIDMRIAVMLIALAVGYAFLNALVIAKTSTGQNEVERHHYNLSGRVGDVIGNVAIVQSYGRLSAEVDDVRRLIGELLARQYPVLTWWGLLAVLTRSAATITMVAVFALGAVLVSRGELTVGQIVSFVAFAGLLISKLDQLSSFAVRTHQSAPVLKTYFDLIDEKSGIVEKPHAEALPPVAGHVVYEGLTYRFPGSDQGVFDLDFEAKPGMTVALVGPTGAGKTTTLALLQRLRMPDAGRILIDGHDIADVTLASLRQSIAVVFQDAGLFNRSIAENIQIGRASATQQEIEQAARMAEAHDFITAKPGSYDYVIGERGALLSGGERQRLAIARAILKDAPILVLDEATSALDVETEGRIRRAIDALREGRTTFIIAHRLSTVTDADVILVMDQGRIVERGSFAELIRMNGRFARMVQEGGFTVPDADESQDPLATIQRQA